MQQGSSVGANGAASNNIVIGPNAPPNGAATSNVGGITAAALQNMTDEQILELGPLDAPGNAILPNGVLHNANQEIGAPGAANDPHRHSAERSDEESLLDSDSHSQRDSSADANRRPQNDNANDANAPEPAWLTQMESSSEPSSREAAVEARRWREAAVNSAALDRDYFSASPQDRAGLAARLHETDPAAFRSMLADAARVLAERDPQSLAELAQQLTAAPESPSGGVKSLSHVARNPLGSPRQNAVGADPSYKTYSNGNEFVAQVGPTSSVGRPEAFSGVGAPKANPQRDSSAINWPQNDNMGAGASAFPADAYRQFAAATNADVEHQVRDSIERALSSTLPDGIADGARRRISDDIFRDLNSALSADGNLNAQISSALSGHRFDAGTSRQIALLLSNRARVALPEVARRVIAEWTSSVLASDRARHARIDSALSRRDITGGRLPEPVNSSALLPRRVDYTRTSDEQILEM